MGGEFCFFTDPALLGAQAAADAFGPEGLIPTTGSVKDRFRVTDSHQAEIPMVAKAYAVCRGHICLQPAGGNLTIILRPLIQPPFDFPYVEYFIYRGVRADSLLASDGQLDLGKEGTGANLNQLVAYIREKVLKLAPPQTTKVTSAHLGLDREHDSATTAVNGGSWGDDQPLDHLFRYPGAAELPIVEAGWALGDFAGTFGFEVVVQQYGAQPKIGWARNADPWIEADPIATGATAAAAYTSRLQREAIGCYVDPCAFWGMFWSDGLTIAGEGVKNKDQLHGALFGSSPAIFANRERAWLDIRNEVGLSYDFYGRHQDQLQVGPNESGLAVAAYSSGGWPIHNQKPAPAAICFRLHRDGASSPLLFVRQGGSNTPTATFRDLLDANDPQWTEPVTFKRNATNPQPPSWFVAHYLRGETGTLAEAAAPGAFDTSALQFGPIGDRVLTSYRQVWPLTTSTVPATPGDGYVRQFVTDKVFRHDGAVKADPVDATRSLAYDRMGETSYVFQKGIGSKSGKDSVIIIQVRGLERKRTPGRLWYQATIDQIASAGGRLLFNSLFGGLLGSPASVTLASAGIVIPSYYELLNQEPLRDEALKTELFDFTVLVLSKAAFDTALSGATPGGPPPRPGEAHPVFLGLGPPAQVDQALARDLGWKSWDGQNVTGLATPQKVYSADGIFFFSPDAEPTPPSAPSLTVEEADATTLWDGVMAYDTKGSAASKAMGVLADDFIAALLGVDIANPDPPAALLAIVEQYGAAIWKRGSELAADSDAEIEKWSDLILYYARLKMGVALKSHPLVAGNPALRGQLGKRFEELSRNYSGLDFAGAAASDRRVIVTGFDPFGNEGTSVIKTSNPSGRHALYVAAHPQRVHSPGKDFFAASCIFPVRWADFDRQIVETTLEASIQAAAAQNKPVALICTVSLDADITDWMETKTTKPITSLYCKIDGFAAMYRAPLTDNLNVLPNPMDLTLPAGTGMDLFYETSLKNADFASYNSPLAMKVRYDWSFSAAVGTTPVIFPKNYALIAGQTIWAPPHKPQSNLTLALEGSGGDYLSNEIYYRCSNLLRAKYTGIKNGHIHVPLLQEYTRNGASLGLVRVAALANGIAAAIHGEL